MIVSFSVLVFIVSAQMRHLPDVKHCSRSWDTSVNKSDTSPASCHFHSGTSVQLPVRKPRLQLPAVLDAEQESRHSASGPGAERVPRAPAEWRGLPSLLLLPNQRRLNHRLHSNQ
ncbi:TPA: hypothetical protein BOS_23753 [Bos taurus]|nr:TPA: hypothetical protein BOS_23753 [Bos taurus]